MQIINESELIAKLSNYSINFFKVEKFTLSNHVFLESHTIDDFLRFSEDSGFKVIYYMYTYYKIEDYVIPLDWYSEETKEFKTDVEKHNVYVKKLDFNLPKHLSLFTLQNGVYVGIDIENHWIDKLTDMNQADKAIELIEKKYYGGKDQLKKTNREDVKRDENELRELIFKDPEFKYCKNQDLRYWYLVDLLGMEDMSKYNYLFRPHFGIASSGKVKVFMDKTWMLYKEK